MNPPPGWAVVAGVWLFGAVLDELPEDREYTLIDALLQSPQGRRFLLAVVRAELLGVLAARARGPG